MSASGLLFVWVACRPPDAGAPTSGRGDGGDTGPGITGVADSGATGTDSGTHSGDDGGHDSGADPGDGWFGEPLEPPWPVPAFVATNRDGAPRGPEHLVGDPTIIWFYRDAGTAG
ncbi:MAG: hypothetical protein H6742_10415 [Alphaproteobacteria bacterium]|nr:hypothetical protein [Alphaproteobacteria bacterium]